MLSINRRALDPIALRKAVSARTFQRPWIRYAPKHARDVRKLVLDFETRTKADTERDDRKDFLWQGDWKDRALGDLLDLAPSLKPANLTCCPITAREVRIWWGGELLRVFERFGQCWVIHPILHRDAVPFGKLASINIDRLKMRIRRQLERSVSCLVIAMGGLEFDADYDRKLWVPHFHIAIANCTRARLQNLGDHHYKRDGAWEALLQIMNAKNRPRQFVYTQKFWAARRHHQQTGPKRAPAFRLRLPEHNEYLRFLVRLSPMDLLFAMGVTRSNSQKFKITVPLRDA